MPSHDTNNRPLPPERAEMEQSLAMEPRFESALIKCAVPATPTLRSSEAIEIGLGTIFGLAHSQESSNSGAGIARSPNSRYQLHIDHVRGEVRVSSNGEVEYANSSAMVEKLYQLAREEELTRQSFGARKVQEIRDQAQKESVGVLAFYDTARGRIVAPEFNGSSPFDRARYSALLTHEVAHAKGDASETSAFRAQERKMNAAGYELTLRDQTLAARKVAPDESPRALNDSALHAYLRKHYPAQADSQLAAARVSLSLTLSDQEKGAVTKGKILSSYRLEPVSVPSPALDAAGALQFMPAPKEYQRAIQQQWLGKVFEAEEQKSFEVLMTQGRIKLLALSVKELSGLYATERLHFGERQINRTTLSRITLPIDPSHVRWQENEGPVQLIHHEGDLYIVNGNHRAYKVATQAEGANHSLFAVYFEDIDAFQQAMGYVPTFIDNRSGGWTTCPLATGIGDRVIPRYAPTKSSF